ELTRSEKRRLRSERFELEAEKGRAERGAALAAIQRGTALAWLDRHYAEAMARVIGEQSAEARLEVEAAETAYRGGRGSQADVFAAHAALAALDDRASEYRRRVRTATTALARWIDDDAQRPLAAPPSMESVHLHTATLPADLERHPEIVALTRQAEVAAA